MNLDSCQENEINDRYSTVFWSLELLTGLVVKLSCCFWLVSFLLETSHCRALVLPPIQAPIQLALTAEEVVKVGGLPVVIDIIQIILLQFFHM